MAFINKVCWQCLFRLMRQQHCWSTLTFRQTQLFEMVLTNSERMTFSFDKDIYNGLVGWTSVVMVLVLTSYVSGFSFVCVN